MEAVEGQEETVQDGLLPDHSMAAAELFRWGCSSFISIWFFRGPVKMFWTLHCWEEEEEEEEEVEEALEAGWATGGPWRRDGV